MRGLRGNGKGGVAEGRGSGGLIEGSAGASWGGVGGKDLRVGAATGSLLAVAARRLGAGVKGQGGVGLGGAAIEDGEG